MEEQAVGGVPLSAKSQTLSGGRNYLWCGAGCRMTEGVGVGSAGL